MRYEVTGETPISITVWDGETRDPDHPGESAGKMTMIIGSHDFKVGDEVELVLRKVDENYVK